MNSSLKIGLLALAGIVSANAGFHLTLDIGSLKDASSQELTSGTVIVMVSTGDNTFTPPAAGGTFATVGDDEYVGSASITDGDENILKIFAPDYGANWTAGDPIGVYFIPAAIGPNDVLAEGQAFGFYSKADGEGEGDPWVLPADGALLTNLKMFTADVDEIASSGSVPTAVGSAGFAIGTAIADVVQPASVSATSGTPGVISVDWQGGAAPGGAYRVERRRLGQTTWKVLGFADDDATSFNDDSVSGGETYNYRVFAINGFGVEVSSPAEIQTDILARLANISSRAVIGSGDEGLFMGFVVRGGGDLPVLARAAGPTLREPPFNISTAAGDTRLSLFNGAAATIGSNDDWASDQATEKEAAFTAAGAFAFAADSKDAAILTNVDSTVGFGVHSFAVDNLANDGGLGLVEVYDLPEDDRIRFINLSSRAKVGTGDNILIGGLAIKGPGSIRLLIRGIGPKLADAPFNLTGVLEDPTIAVYRGAELIASNDNWVSGDVQEAFNAAGAFPLNAGSKDSALVVELTQGQYSVLMSGVNGTGIGLLEFFELIE